MSPLEEKEEGLYEPGGQCHDRESIETAHLSSWEHIDLAQQLGNLHGTDLGPLYVCDSCIAWAVCKAPKQ